MSTETLTPPPPTELKQNSAPVTIPPSLTALFEARNKKDGVKPNPEPVIVEQKVEEPKVETPPKEEKPKVEPVVPPVVENDKEKNFAALRAAREKAESDHKAAVAELENLRKELDTYKVRVPPEEVERLKSELEGKLENTTKELRMAAIWRDPAFRQKYDDSIVANQKRMIGLLASAGVPQVEAREHVAAWNKGKFNEWLPDLPLLQQSEFATLVANSERLNEERQSEIDGGETRWKEHQEAQTKAQKQKQEQFRKEFVGDAEHIFKELTKEPVIAADEALTAQVQADIMRATQLNEESFTRKEILQKVGLSTILTKIASEQFKELEDNRAAIAEKDRKIAELEAFVAGKSSSVPRPGDSNGSPAGEEKYVPITQRMRVVIPGR